jgi:hypothetical protein
MRVYLDTCVIQDLKKENNKDLLEAIIQSKGELIYCFSEAHLYDLARDKTDEKFGDMLFMEQIVGNNCFHYDKGFIGDYFTPTEYYNRFKWPGIASANEFITGLTEGDDVFGRLTKSFLSAIPMNFKDSISQSQQLPEDMPQDLAEVLLSSSNMYEFMLNMTNYSDTLSVEQSKFKEQLQYLHKNSLTNNLSLLGIEGYDGTTITDKEKFLTSYEDYFLKNANGKGKYRYDLFTDMYNGLELGGFVPGKPRKQKMMNMINDGKHAFFGGFCDIVVSKDDDFINKAKFMYDLREVDTQVLNMTEFADFLNNRVHGRQFSDLETEIARESTNINVLFDIDENGQRTIGKRLSDTYYGYFNTIIYHSNGYIYFTKQNNLFGDGTLVKEIAFCINQLYDEFGLDYNSRGEWIDGEMVKGSENDWYGRVWRVSDKAGIELKFMEKLGLYIIYGIMPGNSNDQAKYQPAHSE